MKDIFSIYEANVIVNDLSPTADTVGYINYTPMEHFTNDSNIKNTVTASEKRNKTNPMRLALGKITKNKFGFSRSHTKVGGKIG